MILRSNWSKWEFVKWIELHINCSETLHVDIGENSSTLKWSRRMESRYILRWHSQICTAKLWLGKKFPYIGFDWKSGVNWKKYENRPRIDSTCPDGKIHHFVFHIYHELLCGGGDIFHPQYLYQIRENSKSNKYYSDNAM